MSTLYRFLQVTKDILRVEDLVRQGQNPDPNFVSSCRRTLEELAQFVDLRPFGESSIAPTEKIEEEK